MEQLTNVNLFDVPAEVFFENDKDIRVIKQTIDEAVNESKDIVVYTSKSLEFAAHYIKSYGKYEKFLEDSRKKLTAPLLEKKREIDTYFKKLSLIFSAEKLRLEKEILNWRNKQQELAKAAADEARKHAEEAAINDAIKKEKELQTKAIIEGKDPKDVKIEVPIVPEVIPDDVKLSQKNSSGLSTMRVAKWKVTDPNKIPKEYFVLDEKKINAIRRSAGIDAVSSIPGIEFYCEETLRRG